MGNLAKYTDSFKLVDDLQDPTLGRLIGDETGLMLSWAGLAIAFVLYLPGAGFISALGLAYLGYKDIKATTGKVTPPAFSEEDEPPTTLAIGPATKLNAVTTPVRALPSGPTEEEPPKAEAFVQSPWGAPAKSRYQGPVYAGPEEKLAATQASTAALAQFRAPGLQEMLGMPIKERAEEMLRSLNLAGCNLKPYIYDTVLIATGTQRSGKSTIIVLIGILEAALMAKKLRYITSDGDIYPVAFSGVANGEKYYGLATKEIEATQAGEASDIVWIFDEVTKQPQPTKEALWGQLLTGFVKTGASARLITHGTTMRAIGFPAGMAEQVKTEAVIVKALRKSDAVGREEAAALPQGGQHPAGEYRRQQLTKDGLQDVKGETLQLPDWLLFDTNEQGHPCYVRTLLTYFPELDARVNGEPVGQLFPERERPPAVTRQSLENLLGADAVHPVEATVVEDANLSSNAGSFARLVLAHLESQDKKVISLARFLADNYTAKTALKQGSTNPSIREKGKETARQLTMECKRLGLLGVEEKGGNSISLSAPPATLFA